MESPGVPFASHTHLILEVLKPRVEAFHLRFRDPRRFGGIWWLGQPNEFDDRMGPEPLTLRPDEFKKQLAGTRRAIKTALLDQSVIAGLGNIYADESLFAAGIHPLIPANQLNTEQIASLNRAIKHILRKAIQHRGSTLRDYRDANGESGGFQLRHKVYDRTEQPCRICKKPIQRIVLGGRSTHFCARCQG
jgi:formamidopyrimidine-DNA glycosylase